MQNIQIQCLNSENGFSCNIPASDPFITPFLSSGDIIISILLLLLFLVELIKLLRTSFGKVEVVRNYQGNNSPDGKEFYKI